MSERAKTLWLRPHAPGEKRFAKAVRDFLDQQASELAQKVQGFDSASDIKIGELFKVSDEHDKFMKVVDRQLLALMLAGAEIEMELHAPKKSKAHNDGDDDDSALIDLPKEVLAAIRKLLNELESQDYWRTIQETTRGRLAGVIEQGIKDGEPLRVIADRIERRLGGDNAKGRALAIARTETTGALNAGHHAARQELIADRLVTGSQWVAIEDADTRETHAALDGTTVGDGEEFDVGGERAPYPGWWGLSPAERVNCRCTTVAAGTFAD
jgi:hypothetical protein